MIIQRYAMQAFLGTARNGFSPELYRLSHGKASLHDYKSYNSIQQHLGLQKLYLLNQVHGTHGLIITPATFDAHYTSFSKDGDFLITNMPRLGIGILTADCLPILFYDKIHTAVAIAHAGWKGSLAHISSQVLKNMYALFSTEPEQVEVILGPCARKCCYQVKKDFLAHVPSHAQDPEILQTKEESFYFDLANFQQKELILLGVQPEAICTNYAHCTICCHDYYSYRRQKEHAGRQLTVISLI